MVIPLEQRAHVIVAYNPNFIARIPDIPSGTEKVYYKGLALQSPSWMSAEDAAEQLANAEDREVVDRLELTPTNCFTHELSDAMTFRYDEVCQEAKKLQLSVGTRLTIEDLNEEWRPF